MEKIYNLVEILEHDIIRLGDTYTPLRFRIFRSDDSPINYQIQQVTVVFGNEESFFMEKTAIIEDDIITVNLSTKDPILPGNVQVEIKVINDKKQIEKFPTKDILSITLSPSIEDLKSRIINEYTVQQFSDKIDILLENLDVKYKNYIENLKKDVSDYLNNSVKDNIQAIQTNVKENIDEINAKTTEFNNNLSSGITTINDKVSSANEVISKTANDTNKLITDTGKSVSDTMNKDLADFKDTVAKNGFTKPSDLVNYQKIKITQDNGNIEFLTGFDFNDPGSKLTTYKSYCLTAASNPPVPYGSTTPVSGYGFLQYLPAGVNNQQAIYQPYNSMKTFRAVKWDGVWLPWKDQDELMLKFKETAQNAKLTQDNGVNKRLNGIDLNTLFEQGFFYCIQAINRPDSWGNIYLIVMKGSEESQASSYYKQIAFEYKTGRIAIRDRLQGAMGDTNWTDWTVIETETGSTQKVVDLKTLLIDLMPVAENGGSKKRFSGTTDMVAEIQSLKKGIYTYYAPGGTPNAPTTGANRGLIIKTDDTVGYVWATDTQANFYSGYQNGASAWTGWKPYASTLLWSGSSVATVGKQYALSQSRENFRKLELLVEISGVGEYVVSMSAKGNNNANLEVFNVFDDPTGVLFYELVITKIADTTRLEIRSEARHNLETRTGLINNKDWTIKEIWGVN